MSPYTPYLGLAIFPLASILVINPVQFRWGMKHPFEPMPPDVAKRTRTLNRRYLGFAMNAFTILFVMLLMSHVSVSARAVGLSASRWELYATIGIGAGAVWLGLQELVSYFSRGIRPKQETDEFQEGATVLWISFFLTGVFAEEFWRAFCIIAFLRAGDSISFAIIMTAIVFALSHSGRSMSGRIGIIPFGIAAALLFVACGSLAATFSFHLVVNVGSFYRIRLCHPPVG